MRYFTLVLLVLITTALTAQVRYGTIDYVSSSESKEMDEMAEEDLALGKAMKEMAASGAFTTNWTATFGPGGFTFRQQVKPMTQKEIDLGGGSVIMVQTGGEEPELYHTDTEAKKLTNTRNIFDRKFLVTGDAAPVAWTMTGRTIPPSEETIGLELKEATGVNAAGDTMTAGYAPALPVQVGPRNIYGLPGAIITLKIDRGQSVTTYRATAMSVSPTELELIVPDEGKAIGAAKFAKEKAKRDKMIRRQYRN